MHRFIDTNILLYAVNSESEFHDQAKEVLEQTIFSPLGWCLSWGVIYEFLRVSTHQRVFSRPLKAKEALNFIKLLLQSETLTILSENNQHLDNLEHVVSSIAHPQGNIFHDLHSATLLMDHGVKEIVTHDRDFLQFKHLNVINPFS